MIIKAWDLKDGEFGVIVDLKYKEQNCFLFSLGFCEGQRLFMVKKGDPCIVNVMNSRYVIREDCMKCIEVLIEV